MNKTAIKKFAVNARKSLIELVKMRAARFGILPNEKSDPSLNDYKGYLFSKNEKKQRADLIKQVEAKGYEKVIEEVAYTWFNRFCALRFMEVNGYLPSMIRVFSDENEEFKPEILSQALDLDLEGLDPKKIRAYKEKLDDDGLFKYLIVAQCNALYDALPSMFQKIDDYTELLFPDFQLKEGSVVWGLVNSIDVADWKDQVQIIGWLYQYYITELNELVYDGSLSKAKISKDLLPSATTIYTPDWPVRYMVENSLGRLWLEGHPNEALKSEWKYYLDDVEQDENVQTQLAAIRKGYAALKPEEIKVIDPCMGSGHILCVLFDVFVQIYKSYGYTERDAAVKIVENNLWGLDIDDRAAQFAYFAVMMKARQYDNRFFARKVQPRVFSIQESNGIDKKQIELIVGKCELSARKEVLCQFSALLDCFQDAKEYGSIITVPQLNWKLLLETLDKCDHDSSQLTLDIHDVKEVRRCLAEMLRIGEALSQKYHVVVTNPPYLGSNRFSTKLDSFVKEHFQDVKSDLSMVIYKRALESMIHKNGFVAFITTNSWMFLSKFEKLRDYVISRYDIISLVDFGTELFDGKVGHNLIVSWIVRNSNTGGKLTGIRLVDYCYSQREEKEVQFLSGNNRYETNQENFSKIPGHTFGYWVGAKVLELFTIKSTERISSSFDVKAGICTGENTKFILFWPEVDFTKSIFQNQNYLYTAHNKGGAFRKWYGNRDCFLKYNSSSLKEMETRNGFRHDGKDYYFHPHVGWSKITSNSTSFRFYDESFTFDSAGLGLFPKGTASYKVALAFLNSKISKLLISLLNPTLNVTPIIIKKLPFRLQLSNSEEIEDSVDQCIAISRKDWDSFESSWDFQIHPLINKSAGCLEEAYNYWENETHKRFNQLKRIEENLNKIFIDIYGLQDEITPEADDREITVRKADKEREVKSLISYAVGCMFGRYSLDKPGLIYAGGKWDSTQYKTFAADLDNIIPITLEEDFDDDIVKRFEVFLVAAYGKETLEENLQFVADALGGKGTSRNVIRNYFLNGFFDNHKTIYQKRPIYWLLDSGKNNGFKGLLYLHRYDPDLLSRVRADYLHPQQGRYAARVQELDRRIAKAQGAEKVRLQKERSKAFEQEEELRIFEEKIHHLADQRITLDLDDGVKINYAKLQDVLADI